MATHHAMTRAEWRKLYADVRRTHHQGGASGFYPIRLFSIYVAANRAADRREPRGDHLGWPHDRRLGPRLIGVGYRPRLPR